MLIQNCKEGVGLQLLGGEKMERVTFPKVQSRLERDQPIQLLSLRGNRLRKKAGLEKDEESRGTSGEGEAEEGGGRGRAGEEGGEGGGCEVGGKRNRERESGGEAENARMGRK